MRGRSPRCCRVGVEEDLVSSRLQPWMSSIRARLLAVVPHESVSANVDDVTHFGRRLTAWDAFYEQLTPGAFDGGAHEVWLADSLEILWETGNRSVWTAGSNRPGMVSLGIPVAAGGAGVYCGVPLHDGAVSWLPEGSEFEIYCRDRMDIVSATVSAAALQAFSAVASPALGAEVFRRPFIRLQPRQAAILRRALVEIIGAVRARPGLLEIAASRTAMCDCVMSSMLDALEPAQPRAASSLRPSVKAWIVRSARACVLDSPGDPIGVADLCRMLKVSRRSLQYAFEELTGIGAVQFLRNVRLNAVRRELHHLGRQPQEPIAAVAARWGFWHMPRFAAYYRVLFDELPSETRARQGGNPGFDASRTAPDVALQRGFLADCG